MTIKVQIYFNMAIKKTIKKRVTKKPVVKTEVEETKLKVEHPKKEQPTGPSPARRKFLKNRRAKEASKFKKKYNLK